VSFLETKMRINGTYGEYEKSKVRENKKSYISTPPGGKQSDLFVIVC